MKRIIIAMTLILALALGVAAQAEVTEPEAPVEQSERSAPEDAAAPADEPADEEATLEDAFNALFEARLSTKLEELQAELDEYVAAGKLTQEQADLIMNSIKERQEAKQDNDGRDWRQMPGNQRQCPGMQGGNRQFGQCPGMQGGNQMPQMPGNQQGGNDPFGQFPGQR